MGRGVKKESGMKARVLAAMVVIMVMGAAAVGAPETAAPLSADEVKKLANAGQYQDALKALVKILTLKGEKAAGYDRHEMLMLKAECQLQLKMSSAALDTLELARKEAATALAEDQAMQSQALAMLIKASPGGTYTPQTGTIRKPIPIADKTLRKGAYDSMLGDQLAQINVKVKQAKAANKLPPVAEAAKQVVAIRPVEKASAGDNKATDELLADLSKLAMKMVSAAVDDLATEIKKISDAANRVVSENVTLQDPSGRAYVVQQTHRVGLSGNDRTSLKNAIAECGKISGAAGELGQFFSTEAQAYKDVATKASLTKDKATATLNDDYTSNIR